MGNPYYIAPDNTGLQVANFGLNLADTLMRRKQATEALQESSRQHNISAWGSETAQPGVPTIAQRDVTAREMQVQTDRNKLGVLGSQYTNVMSGGARAKAINLGADKALKPYLDELSTYGKDPQFTMERAHDSFVSNWAEKRGSILDSLEAEYAKGVSSTPGFETSEKGMKLARFMEKIGDDEDGSFVSSVLFPGVAEAKGLVRGKVQSEIHKNMREGYDTKTIYGPNGEVAHISIQKGQTFALPQGWSDKSPVTDDMREYNKAVSQGYRGTFEQWQVKMKKAGATNVNLAVGTQTQLQKDIIEQQTQIDTLTEIDNLFKDEYLTYLGRGKQFAGKVGEKLGTTVIDEKWLNDRSTWYQITKQNQIAFRKWATGVAGSAKELEEIARAYPDPDKNSPTEFKAMLNQAKANAIRLKKRYNMFLTLGINPTKEQLSTVPLSSISVDEGELSGGISQEAQTYLKSIGQ